MTYLNFHNCTDCHGVSFIASPPHSPHAPCSLPNCFSLNAPKLLCMQIAICARKRHTDCSSTDYGVGINGDNNGRGSTVAQRGDAAIANQLRIRPTMLAHSEWVSSIRKHQQTVSSSRTDANSPTWLNTKTNTHGSGNGGKASQPASRPVSLSAFVALRQAL